MHRRLLSPLLVCASIVSLTALARAADPEMRASWFTRFEWPNTDEATCKQTIRDELQALKDANFNTVLFQIRGECDTLYPSPYEPWGPQFNWTDPGWDPTAYAIQEAHARGLKFYAYINTHAISADIPPAVTVPQHVYNLHCVPGASPNWQIHGLDGLPAGLVSEYIWMSPGVPDAEAWTRQQIMYVVKTYDIDGLHFDRIRSPSEQYSHDPVSEARFAGDGNPDSLEWGDWMRAQFTRQLRRIYGEVNEIKPHVVVTAAPFGICKREPGGFQGAGTQSYYSWHQDSFGWMESHVLDAIYPMIYWDIGSAQPYEVLLADFMRHRGGRHIYGGLNVSRNYIAQIAETRRQEAHGTAIFSQLRIDWDACKTGPYTEPAPLPALDWKTTPTLGIIVGTVRDGLGVPVVDARINRSGDAYNYLTGGDGFYAILDVPPGTYTLSGAKPGLDPVNAAGVTVAAGQVVRVDLTFVFSKGILELDKSVYHIGDTMQISLRDANLVGLTSTPVQLVSDTETTTETVMLDSPTSNGVFTATVALRRGAPVADGVLQVAPGDAITVAYHDADTGTGPGVAQAHAAVSAEEVIFNEPMDQDPEWLTEGAWAYGAPTGQGGANGNPDPTAGATGTAVYGYNLDGDYPSTLPLAQYLTTPPIDCSHGQDTKLVFQRWLNIEANSADQASVEVSCDGIFWETVWTNPNSETTDAAWTRQEIDIADQADYKSSIQIRWGLGPTNTLLNYSGWNLDDIQILQIPGGVPESIIDNVDDGFWYSGSWGSSTQGNCYGGTKRFAALGDGSYTATWHFRCIPPGTYAVDFWINDNNYAEDARYHIKHDTAPVGGEVVIASQNWVGDGWQRLGVYSFTGGSVEVVVDNYWEGNGVYVVADALKITPAVSVESSIWMAY